jgi:lipopolysaccharide transport system permease protein
LFSECTFITSLQFIIVREVKLWCQCLFNTLKEMFVNRGLVWKMAARDVSSRYRGSFFGVTWALIQPLLMLGVYTFVFSLVFKARWSENTLSNSGFAIVLFAGLSVHTFFSEVLINATSAITRQPNLIKKVVFPTGVLPAAIVVSALVGLGINLCILILAVLVADRGLPVTSLYLPVVLAPLVLVALGLSFLLSSVGVFAKDVVQLMSLVSTALMFLSPMFYPISAIPEQYRDLFLLNPLSVSMESLRSVLVWGTSPDFKALALQALLGLAVFFFGTYTFNASRKGFADVL